MRETRARASQGAAQAPSPSGGPSGASRETPLRVALEGYDMGSSSTEGTRHVVHVIRKSPKQEIRISLSRYKGRTFGDVRLFVPDQQGEWVPTTKGCTVGVEQLGELEEAVVRLRDASDPTAHQPF
jgi:hypothetical protein